MADIEALFGALLAELRGMREDIKGLEKKLPLAYDPEKLKASTKDPSALPMLSVVNPKDPDRPNIEEPWPPGTRQRKPDLVR